VRGIVDDVIDDGDVIERRVEVVSGDEVRRVGAVQHDQLKVVAGRREQPVLRSHKHKKNSIIIIIYKSLFTEENGSIQKHSSESINTNKAKTATKSVTVVDTWNYIIIVLHQT